MNAQTHPLPSVVRIVAESPMVSVIIPVLNDAERLQLCLHALMQQTYRRDRYEVIVVDNDSEDKLAIAQVVSQFEAIRLVVELAPGSYAARNRGIALARGEVLAFTDADCIPASDWLEQGVRVLLATPNCGLVAGKIDLFFQDVHHPTPIELYESVTAFPQATLLAQEKGGATANVLTWRALFEQVGLFDPMLRSRGDLEWGQRVFAAGYQQVYAEAAIVQHPARDSLTQLYRRTTRLAGGQYSLQTRTAVSWLDRNLVFSRMLLQNLVPPLLFVWTTFRDRRLLGLRQKLAVSLVMFFVRYVTAWELLRLKLGGTPERA